MAFAKFIGLFYVEDLFFDLLSLSRSDLMALAAGIRTRRLSAPYTVWSVGRLLAPENATSAANGLQAMADSGSAINMGAAAVFLYGRSLQGHGLGVREQRIEKATNGGKEQIGTAFGSSGLMC